VQIDAAEARSPKGVVCSNDTLWKRVGYENLRFQSIPEILETLQGLVDAVDQRSFSDIYLRSASRLITPNWITRRELDSCAATFIVGA
jgi:hypothetical protein